jgi:hypothetical protein
VNRILLISLVVVAIFLAIVLETTIVNFPFIFFMGAAFLILVKKIPMYIAVVILGFIIDSLRVTNFGITPLFLIGIMLMVFVYERYTGSKDYAVATIFVIAAGIFYTKILLYSPILTWGFIFISLLTWYLYQQFSRKKIKASYF